MPENVIFCWSGGKDSALALYEIINSRQYNILTLLTTVTEDYDRISMHGVRRVLLEQQAMSLNLPLEIVYIPKDCTNEEYQNRMVQILEKYQRQGTSSVVFGDIFLEDVRKYREENLAKMDMKGIFPLWKKDSHRLTRKFIDSGFKAIVTCVDAKVLDGSFAGRIIDDDFIKDLPENIDPNGENGEFHSFVFDGPIFKEKIPFSLGEVVQRDSLYFVDLLPI
jgi:uncharacterized protein (TIGR00290 family)